MKLSTHALVTRLLTYTSVTQDLNYSQHLIKSNELISGDKIPKSLMTDKTGVDAATTLVQAAVHLILAADQVQKLKGSV